MQKSNLFHIFEFDSIGRTRLSLSWYLSTGSSQTSISTQIKMFPSTWKYVFTFFPPFFQTTISIKRDFYLHATRSLINVLAWIYYRRYCCAYFAEDLRARMNARGRSRRAREALPYLGEFSGVRSKLRRENER